ncbi:BrnA antitoxin family protein [Enterovirga rhinocerotis]|uniref:Uncharacterized protein (DUF4415 family) n=1 Tax=Enterovirga rhinocerotis TaxID=1339210 RepID=A0A4R7BP78_9HYPH|nr:BrnA antitoxin family protein [Enterovirga rhinocerotis]TDR87328.1 uncharacterized protein (DUF4415 family) [Enterovirga rhinocerotis]
MSNAEKAAPDKAQGYTDEDLAEVEDSPEWTAEDFAAAKPFAEVFPDLAASIRRTRGKQKAPTKVAVGIRLSADVAEHYRKSGRGWQTRVDDILRKAAGL